MAGACTCSPKRSRRGGPTGVPSSSAAPDLDVVFPGGSPGQRARSWFVKHTLPAIDEAFQPGELSFPIVIRYGVEEPLFADDGYHVAGLFKHINQGDRPPAPDLPDWIPTRYEFVDIAGRSVGIDTVMIHELVHARKHVHRRNYGTHARDEIDTDLEMLARNPYRCLVRDYDGVFERTGHVPGEYDAFGETSVEAMWHDRKVLTGNIRRNLVGHDAVMRATDAFPQTKLGTLASRAGMRRSRRLWMAI